MINSIRSEASRLAFPSDQLALQLKVLGSPSSAKAPSKPTKKKPSAPALEKQPTPAAAPLHNPYMPRVDYPTTFENGIKYVLIGNKGYVRVSQELDTESRTSYYSAAGVYGKPIRFSKPPTVAELLEKRADRLALYPRVSENASQNALSAEKLANSFKVALKAGWANNGADTENFKTAMQVLKTAGKTSSVAQHKIENLRNNALLSRQSILSNGVELVNELYTYFISSGNYSKTQIAKVKKTHQKAKQYLSQYGPLIDLNTRNLLQDLIKPVERKLAGKNIPILNRSSVAQATVLPTLR